MICERRKGIRIGDSSSPARLEVEGICKSFPGVRALHGVDLRVADGEVLAVVGENGAGKSTLMKILAGIHPADQGIIHMSGVRIEIGSVYDAMALGIALIHQELNLADNLTIGANIFLGREPRRHGIIDRRAIATQTRELLTQLGLHLDPETIVGDLTIGHQQMVEIAKALSINARVLIMDEPTSSLSAGESDRLFDVIAQLRKRGVSIIYISHRLAEVIELADRVTVLRDGENAGELAGPEITRPAMVRMMVGRDVSQFYARQQHSIGDVVLKVEGLITPSWPASRIDLELRRGEIVGLAGLVGAGRTELLRTLFGIDRGISGSVTIDGRATRLRSPRDAISAGMALVPEDRKLHGLIVGMPVRHNIGLASLRRHRRGPGFLNQAMENQTATEMTERLSIKTPSQLQIAQFLSGGNQQKVVIGKWLAMDPKVLLLDEPTRGIDVGAKEEIYGLIESLARDGMAILFASSEMEEILGLSDRVVVMHEGQIAGLLTGKGIAEESIMHLATGATNHHVNEESSA